MHYFSLGFNNMMIPMSYFSFTLIYSLINHSNNVEVDIVCCYINMHTPTHTRTAPYLGPVGWNTAVRELLWHILLQVPPLDLQGHGHGADSLEGAGHLHVFSLPHTHITGGFSKCSCGIERGEGGSGGGVFTFKTTWSFIFMLDIKKALILGVHLQL